MGGAQGMVWDFENGGRGDLQANVRLCWVMEQIKLKLLIRYPHGSVVRYEMRENDVAVVVRT
jgi:hypothetical protein